MEFLNRLLGRGKKAEGDVASAPPPPPAEPVGMSEESAGSAEPPVEPKAPKEGES